LCGRFDESSNGSAAVGHAPIGSVSVDLIALLFRFLEIRRQYNTAAGGVRLQRMRSSRGIGHIEHGLKHLDNVIKGMLLIVQNDDVVELAELVFCSGFEVCV